MRPLKDGRRFKLSLEKTKTRQELMPGKNCKTPRRPGFYPLPLPGKRLKKQSIKLNQSPKKNIREIIFPSYMLQETFFNSLRMY
jgi:hypothetical protein